MSQETNAAGMSSAFAPVHARVKSFGKQTLPALLAMRTVRSAARLWLVKTAMAGLPGYCAARGVRPALVMTGEVVLNVKLFGWRISWPSTKKNALFLMMGPPKVPPKTLLTNLSRRPLAGSARWSFDMASSELELR